jgi:exonuclease III
MLGAAHSNVGLEQHRRPAILRVASHNIHGNISSFAYCVQAWRKRKFHVVALQEVHALAKELRSSLRLCAQQHGFRMVWSVCKENARSAGVAFLVSAELCETLPTAAPRLVRDNSGRVLCLHLNWGGRSLWFVNAYVPCMPNEAKLFLRDTLAPHLLHPPGQNTQTVLLGDWNFVPQPTIDRKRVDPNNHHPTASDRVCPAVFALAAPGVIDTFRAKHPTRRACTHAGFHGGARLDRVYVSAELLPYVSQAGILSVPEYFSDHRPVYVHIAAAEGCFVRGRDVPPRVRCWFWDDPMLRHSFELWVSVKADNAPEGAGDLLLWWPAFKSDMVQYVRELNQLQKARSQPPPELRDQRNLVASEIVEAWRALESAPTAAAAAAALLHLTQTRRKWAAILAAMRRHGQSVEPPPPWLHYNETPNPAFTAVMRPPLASKLVHALRHPHGHLVGPGKGQANIMLQHYVAISTAPPPEPAALQEVLQAIPAHGPTGLSPEAADALGHPFISASELHAALKHSKPGKSPGDDGIPVELYRKGGQPMLQLLAKVLSAMGDVCSAPPHFLNGVISSMHKADDPTLPSNYRPITLLNTDYRLLAKVLANRCIAHTSHLISREQCAFLKGRNIGDSIMLLQLLPHQLAAEGHRGGLVAFLDFQKAYDSVNRDFLRQVLLTMGVGQKFVSWVMLLLSPATTACAVLNGFKSTQLAFRAGVRQGCPLAPLLYLFVGEALLRFMKAQPELGIVLAGSRRVAAQYADDVDPFLKDAGAVAVLLRTMSVFGDASNQRLNSAKTKLLPVGPPSLAPVPATVAGIPVVASATTLGITFQAGMADAQPKREWQHLADKLASKFRTLGGLPLSPFGRAMGATSYALSKVLYYLEHTGLPSAQQLDALQKALAKLVDRANKNGFTYVRKELLVGPAKQGGFGMLDVGQHITARHAVWAVKLVTGDEEVPWIHMGRALLRHLWGAGWHAMLPLQGAAQHPAHASHSDPDVRMPGPLARIFHALHQLPTLHDVAAAPLQLGPWCASAPIVGNPWIVNHDGQVLGRDNCSEVVLRMSRSFTVGGLVEFTREAQAASEQEWRGSRWALFPLPYARERTLPHLQFLPGEWSVIASAAPAPQHPPGPAFNDAVRMLLDRLGWRFSDVGSDVPVVVPLSFLSVRMAYRMLLQPAVDLRVQRWRQFIADASGMAVVYVDDAMVKSLQGVLGLIWRRVKWSNNRKYLYWQLVVDGIPTSARHNTGASCYCSAESHACPDRMHHFWHCPAAVAVVAEMCRCLGVSQLHRKQVWLMKLPDQMGGHGEALPAGRVRGALKEVWMVVCLAALQAMWVTAKKIMGPNIRAALAAQPRGLHTVVVDSAVAAFWELLHEFAQSSSIPGSWRRLLPQGTPFLHFPQLGRRIQVNTATVPVPVHVHAPHVLVPAHVHVPAVMVP